VVGFYFTKYRQSHFLNIRRSKLAKFILVIVVPSEVRSKLPNANAAVVLEALMSCDFVELSQSMSHLVAEGNGRIIKTAIPPVRKLLNTPLRVTLLPSIR
jgi:hypothetical protein